MHRVVTIGANLAHGLGHGPIGALLSAWPAVALAGSSALLMTLIRTEHHPSAEPSPDAPAGKPILLADHHSPPALTDGPSLDQTVPAWHTDGHSQRTIARELNIHRRKVKRILDQRA